MVYSPSMAKRKAPNHGLPWKKQKLRTYNNSTMSTNGAHNAFQQLGELIKAYDGNRAENAVTQRQVDTNNKTVSMYQRKKRKPVSRRTKVKRKIKRRFAKKVKKVLTNKSRWNYHTMNFTNNANFNSTIGNRFTDQVAIATDGYPGLTLTKGELSGGANSDLITAVSRAALATESINGVEQNTIASNFRAYFKAKMTNTLFIRGEPDLVDPEIIVDTYTDANPMIIDVYQCVAARNITEASYAHPYTAWVTLCGLVVGEMQSITPVGMQQSSLYNKGAVPWQTAGWSKYWKVESVTRHRLTDQSSPVTWSTYSKGWYSKVKWDGKYAVKGITKACMVIVAPIEHVVDRLGLNMTMSSDKHFQYKIPGNVGGADNMSITYTSQATM